MNLKKVSVIITTKNRKDLLKRAIESVKKQTYKNIELIVINDGSTDGTNEMLEKMKVKTIYIEPNKSKGGNYARNLGVINTDGEYIAFLDDDDEWMPTKIEKQVDILKKYTSLALITISISGAVLHNIGQIMVAVLVMATKEIILWLPVLIITGILSGIGVGILSVLTIRYTKNIQY